MKTPSTLPEKNPVDDRLPNTNTVALTESEALALEGANTAENKLLLPTTTKHWDGMMQGLHLTQAELIFSKPVEVVTLPKGTQVVQYQIPGNPVGGYFAPVGTTAESLGISSVGRNPIIYTTTEDISVLRSTAANTSKNLSLPESARGAGGGKQFFTNNRNVFQPLGQ
ncbi:polymorphic toxin type 46 domain-containing protein [Herbaspirillum frisingense]|uniref:polymorphic toxin type 46 domain-containing protein n=1 Tax=Herbaspirillum frisingense TaxID=92645 RepID=UPI001F31E7FD|nr:polymorphic toxin type 46 domain-containing protein [Herbaspirillum frisingense]UIN21411.1 hypothetical protein LAZ82_23705 [Herbaspirillum frisingense]